MSVTHDQYMARSRFAGRCLGALLRDPDRALLLFVEAMQSPDIGFLGIWTDVFNPMPTDTREHEESDVERL